MLLEAGLTAASRSMAPSLEAVYPSGGKRDAASIGINKIAATTMMADRPTVVGDHRRGDENHGKYRAEVPVISFNDGSWCKLPQPGSVGDGRMAGFRSVSETLEVSPAGGRGIIPERPEPMYPPPASFKPRMPMNTHQPEAADHSAAAAAAAAAAHHHRKAALFMNTQRHSIPSRLPVAKTPTSSATSSSSSDVTTSDAAAAAAAASAFFQRAFHPGIHSYPPPGVPIPGVGAPHPGLHRPPHHGHHPHPHPHPHHHPVGYPGVPASAAGFMSLAHILFQPKYAIGKKTFQCHECRYITDRKNNLKRHIATMHQDCGKFLECCDTIFHSKASLRDHVLMYHRTGYKCRFCGRNFCRKALLKRHLTVHNGQKEFICEVCDYATSHKSNLERHRKVHGLGSPIGSDDEEHFFRDGPDGELYHHLHLHHHLHRRDDEENNMGCGDEIGAGRIGRRDVSVGDIGSRDRTGELYVDVESINTDSITDEEDASVDDVISVISDSNVAAPNGSNVRASQTPHVTVPQHLLHPLDSHYHNHVVPLRADPLLEAFPVTSGSGKIVGRKSKGRLYLADRLRQTYDHQGPPGDAEADQQQYEAIERNREGRQVESICTISKGRDGNMIETECRGDSGSGGRGNEDTPRVGELSPVAATPIDGTPSPPAPPTQFARAGPFPNDRVELDGLTMYARHDKKEGRAGCKRLYASPYKCSECGKGLSSQSKLLEHSMACRNNGVEPARPMKPITAVVLRTLPPAPPAGTRVTAPSPCYTNNAPNIEDSPQDLSMNHTLNSQNNIKDTNNRYQNCVPPVCSMTDERVRTIFNREMDADATRPRNFENFENSPNLNFKFSLKRSGAEMPWVRTENNNVSPLKMGKVVVEIGEVEHEGREEGRREVEAGTWAPSSRQDYSIQRLVAGSSGGDWGGDAGVRSRNAAGVRCVGYGVVPTHPVAGRSDSRTPSPSTQPVGTLLPIKKRSVHHSSN